MSLSNSLDNCVKDAQVNNGEGLSLGRCPVCEERRPDHHQTTSRKKWTKEDKKISITCYLMVKEKGQRG